MVPPVCGIAGIYEFDSGRAVDPEVLDRMTDVLAHRGPDGRGVHIDGSVGLGHRRLSIIDLSEDAAQPMCNEDGTVWLVFNGEIYNFRELRHELAGKGHTFRSKTDSEVLVHLYEEKGALLVDRLRGMFAFALWDARRRRLLLARDRFGQKPLYYRLGPQSLRFASEIKGILQDPSVSREPDLESLDSFLAYGYVPGPKTAFSGIRKLPPGHVLQVEADGRHDLRRYWQLQMTPKQTVAPGQKAKTLAEQRVLELLDEAVRLRMVSDVPLGAFLSGGIDSSAIVASMCIAGPNDGEPPRTFCIGFREPGSDESEYARQVAGHLQTQHRTLQLTPDAVAGLERIAWHYGEPYADPSCLPTFALAGLARQFVTVALTGDGGDELFCGYRRYLAARREERIRLAASPLRKAARSPWVTRLLRRARRKALAKELEHNRRHADLTAGDLYVSRMEVLTPELKAALYSDPLRDLSREWDSRAIVRRAIAASDGESQSERCAHADVTTYLADDILVKVDVASMAHGLECRAPLLDHVLAEFVAGLPFRLKISGWESKAVLKGAVRRRLPRAILSRRKKGFNVPLKSWFRSDLDPFLRETLLSQRAVQRGYFNRAGVESLIDEHTQGEVDRQGPLLSLVMHELWHQLWIDGAGA